VLDL
jgi:hypothetical protein